MWEKHQAWASRCCCRPHGNSFCMSSYSSGNRCKMVNSYLRITKTNTIGCSGIGRIVSIDIDSNGRTTRTIGYPYPHSTYILVLTHDSCSKITSNVVEK